MPLSQSPTATKTRLAIIAASAEALEYACSNVVSAALARGNAVLCAAPNLPTGISDTGPMTGAMLTNLPEIDDTGLSLRQTRRSETLETAIAEWRPDTVLVTGLEPLDMARRAAHRIRLDNLNCLMFEIPSERAANAIQRWMQSFSQRTVLNKCARVILAHESQAAICSHVGLRLPGGRVLAIPGPGADIANAEPAALPPISKGIRVLACTDPGDAATADLVASAAGEITQTHPTITIEHGPFASSSTPRRGDVAISVASPLTWPQLHAATRDAHLVLQLGSRYTFPPGLLAALAVGRPILALARPSHRRVVDERVNGVLLRSATLPDIIDGIKDMLRPA